MEYLNFEISREDLSKIAAGPSTQIQLGDAGLDVHCSSLRPFPICSCFLIPRGNSYLFCPLVGDVDVHFYRYLFDVFLAGGAHRALRTGRAVCSASAASHSTMISSWTMFTRFADVPRIFS